MEQLARHPGFEESKSQTTSFTQIVTYQQAEENSRTSDLESNGLPGSLSFLRLRKRFAQKVHGGKGSNIPAEGFV